MAKGGRLGEKFVNFIFTNGKILALAFAFLVLGGAAAFFTAQPKGFPEVSINIALVTTSYPGATALQVEEDVLKPIEDVVADLRNVSEYSATASDSFGVVVVTFEDGADINAGISDLNAKLSRTQLPEGAGEPSISDINAGGTFDFLIAVTGAGDEYDLYKKAQLVKERFERVDGVRSVEITNPIIPRLLVTFQAERLASLGLDRAQVEAVLKTAQLDLPLGSFYTLEDERSSLSLSKELNGFNEAEELLVAPNVRLRDVATIVPDLDNGNFYNRIGYFEGDANQSKTNQSLTIARSLNLSIKTEADSSILAVAEELEAAREELVQDQTAGEELRLVELFSQADATRDQIDEVKAGVFGENLESLGSFGFLGYIFGGIFLVILFLLIFINWRVALLASLSIPLALGVTAIYLKLVGIDFNTIVLFSMILVLGLVVDPTIVFLEALYRYRHQGFTPREAAAKTINSVGVGVALSAITNFVVFVPFGVVSGFFGEIIKNIPITVIPALIASFLIPAIFYLPVAAFWLKPKAGMTATAQEPELVGAWGFSKWLGRVIESLLGQGFGKKIIRVVVVLMALVAPLLIAGIFVSTGMVKMVQFSSQEDAEAMLVTGTIDETWPFERAVQIVGPVTDYLAKQPEIKSFGVFSQEGNSFNLFVNLWPIAERQEEQLRTATALSKDVNAYLATIKEAEIEAATSSSGPPQDRFPVKVRVFDNDLAKLELVAKDIREHLTSREEVLKAEDSIGSGTRAPSTALVLDSNNPMAVNPMLIAGMIRNRLAENKVVTWEFGGEQFSVVTRSNPDIRSVDQIKQLPLPLTQPNAVLPTGDAQAAMTLAGVIEREEQIPSRHIQRLNGKRYVEVRAKLKDDQDPIRVQTDLNNYLSEDKLSALGLDDEATESKGAADSIARSFTELLIALIIALFIIYVLLVSFFGSLLLPLVILVAIPLGFIGVFPALAATTGQLGFLELLGVVAMAGIVVNVTILIIDFANQLQREGRSATQAIATAVAVRYKAIFLTKLTILGGLLPLAVFSPFWRGLALVVIVGIIASAILSLFVTPVLYVWSKGRDKRDMSTLRPIEEQLVQEAGSESNYGQTEEALPEATELTPQERNPELYDEQGNWKGFNF